MLFSSRMVSDVVQPFWAAVQRGEFITEAAESVGSYREMGGRWIAAALRPRVPASLRHLLAGRAGHVPPPTRRSRDAARKRTCSGWPKRGQPGSRKRPCLRRFVAIQAVIHGARTPEFSTKQEPSDERRCADRAQQQFLW
jgi:hypothetical protein